MAKTKTKEASESTAIAVISPEEQAYLDSLGGDKKSEGAKGFNRLVINTKAKDSDGVKRTIGAWHIEGTDVYFDGIAKFRPVRYAWKLIRYKEENNTWSVVGQSIYFNNFSEEIIDSLGGIALGRKFGSAHTAEAKEATKKLAETYLDIFGFVSFGEEEEEQHPVMFRVRGGKLKKMLDAFNAIPKDKRYSQYRYNLEVFQPEGKTYWDMTVEPDMSQILPIAPILTFDAEVVKLIQDSNNYVLSAYKKNRVNSVENGFEASAKSSMADVTSKPHMDDSEIPF